MSKSVSTGWRTITPGACSCCGCDDDWECDGRGNTTCGCQACPGCGSRDVYGFHEAGCSVLEDNADDIFSSDSGSLLKTEG